MWLLCFFRGFQLRIQIKPRPSLEGPHTRRDPVSPSVSDMCHPDPQDRRVVVELTGVASGRVFGARKDSSPDGSAGGVSPLVQEGPRPSGRDVSFHPPVPGTRALLLRAPR